MVEVFKTNIEQKKVAEQIIQKLLEYYPENKFNFDLVDCDKILRVQGENICIEKIIQIINSNGFKCEILD